MAKPRTVDVKMVKVFAEAISTLLDNGVTFDELQDMYKGAVTAWYVVEASKGKSILKEVG